MAPPELQELRALTRQTFTAYVRMSSTVIIAVVVRLCLDCFGIIVTGQEATSVNFWFAHCKKDGICVLTGLGLFFLSLVGCSLFGWIVQEWIMDPARNPMARRFSFAIIVDAATWVPISVVVGKTNLVVEFLLDLATDRQLGALISSAMATVLTLLCALFTHFAMKHCGGVQRTAQKREAGLSGFGKYFILATLYCLGWAVGWSNWELVLSLMDALEPGRSVHNTLLAVVVISVFVLLTTCFYLRYGPEPIIPDAELQHLCYGHGYSNSIRRSLVSYVIYSCVVFIVMCCSDPTYGILIVLAKLVYPSSAAVFDGKASCVLCLLAIAVTICAALCSAAITKWMKVDEFSSMKFSRSVHDARQSMVMRQRSHFQALLAQVLEDGGDARFIENPSPELRGPSVLHRPMSGARFILEDENSDEDAGEGGDGDAIFHKNTTPRCAYHRMEVSPESATDILSVDSERQIKLDPGAISSALCASVLAYDVLGLVVCFQWGMITCRFYTIVFGHLAGVHISLYALSCVLYAVVVITSISRVVFLFFPSQAERECREFKEPECLAYSAELQEVQIE